MQNMLHNQSCTQFSWAAPVLLSSAYMSTEIISKARKKERQENTTEKTKTSFLIARSFGDLTSTDKQGTPGSTSLKFTLP